MNGVDRPRGFAFAWFKIGNEEVGVYSVHLKSNLITHGDREAETGKNIRKREVAIAQLLTHIHDVIGTKMPTIKGVVIGGDFNTNHDQAMFAAERTLDSLADAGYQNGFEGLALSERVTHPGTHGFPDATFDYVFAKGLTASEPTVAHANASDHWPVPPCAPAANSACVRLSFRSAMFCIICAVRRLFLFFLLFFQFGGERVKFGFNFGSLLS